MGLNITRGKLSGSRKYVFYGVEGIGKSTFASKFPDPVFIDTEDSTKELDVARFEKPTSWTMLLEQVKHVIANPGCCKTLVIDTADWAEQLEIAELCTARGWKGLEDAGYGKGYQYSAEEFGKLLNLLSEVTYKGVDVVMTAHAWLRKVELPDEIGSYDHWEMKTSKKVAPLIREWADAVFFANYKTIVVNVDGQGAQKGKNKAQGGKRMLYTAHTPFWDAKNRLGLPEELPLDFDAIGPYLFPAKPGPADLPPIPPAAPSKSAPTPPIQESPAPPAAPPSHETKSKAEPAAQEGGYVPAVLRPMLVAAGVTEQEVRQVIDQRQKRFFPMGTPWEAMEKAGFVEGWVLPNWDKIVQMIRDDPDRLPF